MNKPFKAFQCCKCGNEILYAGNNVLENPIFATDETLPPCIICGTQKFKDITDIVEQEQKPNPDAAALVGELKDKIKTLLTNYTKATGVILHVKIEYTMGEYQLLINPDLFVKPIPPKGE